MGRDLSNASDVHDAICVGFVQYGLDVLFHRQLLQSPLRVHTSEEADVVFLPIYADIGCRLSQENADDAKAWNEAIETFWSTFQQTYPDADKKPHFVVTGRYPPPLSLRAPHAHACTHPNPLSLCAPHAHARMHTSCMLTGAHCPRLISQMYEQSGG